MLKVGIVGIGFMGMIHYLAYQRIENVKVVALCESYAKERLAGDWTKIKGNFGPQGTQMDLTGIATYDNIEALLADPNVDVVDICLPPAGHAANTIAAELRAGHVDRAVETLKAYPDYACKALGVIAERDRLERELARSRRRLKRVIWAAAIAVALVLLALFA